MPCRPTLTGDTNECIGRGGGPGGGLCLHVKTLGDTINTTHRGGGRGTPACIIMGGNAHWLAAAYTSGIPPWRASPAVKSHDLSSHLVTLSD